MWIKLKKFILDILFPIHCLGCGLEKRLICQNCLNKIPLPPQFFQPDLPRHIDKLLVALDYHHPLVKKIVKILKYPPYASYLSKDLGQLLIKYLQSLSPTSPPLLQNKIKEEAGGITFYLTENNFVLVPIPLSKKKLAFRGFNQAELIAKELSQKFNWPLNPKLLKKTKSTPSQTGLNFSQRRINVKNTFAVNNSFRNAAPKNIILVDDIVTTGATLEQAGKILRQAGAEKIWAIILAKG